MTGGAGARDILVLFLEVWDGHIGQGGSINVIILTAIRRTKIREMLQV